MSSALYLSRPWVSCFEGEDEAAAAAAAAAAAVGEAKLPVDFNPEQQKKFNDALAADRRKHQTQLQKMEVQLQELVKSKSLTEQERQTLKENLDTIAGQLRTKEQQAALEKQQMERDHTAKLAEVEEKGHVWERLFRESTVERSLLDAAVKHDVFNPSQVATLIRPWSRLMEITDEKTGKPNGQYKVMVDMPDVDATTGEQVKMPRSPEDAVKRMKELPEEYGNLFKPNVVAGIGSSSATGGLTPGQGGKIDVRKLTPTQYREIRAKNPELLGLAPKRR